MVVHSKVRQYNRGHLLPETRKSDLAYHWAIKSLALLGGIVTAITLPLLLLTYNQVDRRIEKNTEEVKIVKADLALHTAAQNAIISKERMERLEDKLDSLQADMNELKVKLAKLSP